MASEVLIAQQHLLPPHWELRQGSRVFLCTAVIQNKHTILRTIQTITTRNNSQKAFKISCSIKSRTKEFVFVCDQPWLTRPHILTKRCRLASRRDGMIITHTAHTHKHTNDTDRQKHTHTHDKNRQKAHTHVTANQPFISLNKLKVYTFCLLAASLHRQGIHQV